MQSSDGLAPEDPTILRCRTSEADQFRPGRTGRNIATTSSTRIDPNRQRTLLMVVPRSGRPRGGRANQGGVDPVWPQARAPSVIQPRRKKKPGSPRGSRSLRRDLPKHNGPEAFRLSTNLIKPPYSLYSVPFYVPLRVPRSAAREASIGRCAPSSTCPRPGSRRS